jgi:magnesium-transporting ATPase (P-type)
MTDPTSPAPAMVPATGSTSHEESPGPHALTVTAVAAGLHVDPRHGLEPEEIAARLASSGPNELEAGPRATVLGAIRRAVLEPFVLLLFVAGVLAIVLGEVRDGILVLGGLVPIVGADVLTSYRSERALASLRDATAPGARVRRTGSAEDVLAADIVPGDIVLLRTGDIVPADLRVSRADALLVDRSVLTGESMPELASIEPDEVGAVVADRRSMLFAGTAVVGGRGEGIVVATGVRTELGRIARGLAHTERRRSPLQRELDRLVRILVVVAGGLILVTVGLGFLRGHPAGANLLAGISAAIAAIPEEPPVLLAVILGLGSYRLLRRGVLVRRLSAEETLGAVDLIITDKTGTLTENRLALREVLTPAGSSEGEARRATIALALRAEDDAWQLAAGTPPGSFTLALLAAADDLGEVVQLDVVDLRSAAGPADGRRYSMTWSRSPGGDEDEGLAIGAPEAILALPLVREAAADDWHRLVDREASSGARLLLLARADEPDRWSPVAVLAFADPLRPGVESALRIATRAGIQTMVVTGDHVATATSIARGAGIDAGRVVTGAELATWDDDRLRRELGDLAVVARAAPEDKLRLVDAARGLGRTVAVTGDGVNDAPALQHADVAVAMGSGTAVAKDASDLVLGDDAFATLLFGLREGRRIVANVQKGLVFLVSTHVALLGFILIATIGGYDQPLLPIQILWLELFIDLATSIAFEREPEEPDAMDRPPRPRDRPLLTTSLLVRIAGAGGFSAVAAFLVLVLHDGPPQQVRWLAFTMLVVGQAVRAYANRSLSRPVVSLRPNGFLGAAVIVVIIVQAAIPLIPPLADAFRAVPLGAADWLLVVVVALAPAALAELIRWRTGRDWVA